MTSFISHTTVDCRNAHELSEWWKPVLDHPDLDDDPNLARLLAYGATQVADHPGRCGPGEAGLEASRA